MVGKFLLRGVKNLCASLFPYAYALDFALFYFFLSSGFGSGVEMIKIVTEFSLSMSLHFLALVVTSELFF